MAGKPKAKPDETDPTISPRRRGALLVLFAPDERAKVNAAAVAAGLATGSWIRMVTLKAAKEQR